MQQPPPNYGQGYGPPSHGQRPQTPGYGPPQHHGPSQGYGAPQPPPKKGMSGGKIAAILGIVFVGGCGLLVTVAALNNPNAPGAAGSTTAPPAVAAPGPQVVPEKAAPAARQPKLGEPFKLGDFTYLVKNVQVAFEVGKGFAKKKADEGAAYVLIDFAITNNGNETETVLTDDFRIVDAKGREYRPSSDANTALVMSGGKDLAVTELQPGLKKTMTTAFEMPESAAKGTFTLVIPEKGLLGSDAVRITLK